MSDADRDGTLVTGRQEFVPTTEEVRFGYANHFETVQDTLVHRFADVGEGYAEFDRWLAKYTATVRREAAAEALREAAAELDRLRHCHDVAECAGFVPGEVGRQDAIDAWIAVCEEPDTWLEARAAGLETKGQGND